MATALHVFEQMGEAFGRTLAARMAPRRAPAVEAANPRPTPAARQASRRSAPRAAGAAVKPVKGLTAGALVTYRQGRGTFDAEVIRIDELSKMVTLQRTLDGKRVIRPADRVYGR